MPKKPDWWYEKQLLNHFDIYYGEFEEDVEWHVNPGPRTWKFYIPCIYITVWLYCDENGRVTEKQVVGCE